MTFEYDVAMKLKKIYFVRHAESQDDVESIHQRSDTPLSENGRDQAALLAGRFFAYVF